jgi:hypothetical protein
MVLTLTERIVRTWDSVPLSSSKAPAGGLIRRRPLPHLSNFDIHAPGGPDVRATVRSIDVYVKSA